jgi:hypothetical protein
VELDLEIWLSTVGGERTFTDDEPHNVADVEFSHASQ